MIRGGVEDTRLEALVKDTKKIQGRGQGQLFRGQILSRPRTRMFDAKDTDANILQKKRVFKNFFQAISKDEGLQKNFSGDLQNFNYSKTIAVLELRTEQFLRT